MVKVLPTHGCSVWFGNCVFFSRDEHHDGIHTAWVKVHRLAWRVHGPIWANHRSSGTTNTGLLDTRIRGRKTTRSFALSSVNVIWGDEKQIKERDTGQWMELKIL